MCPDAAGFLLTSVHEAESDDEDSLLQSRSLSVGDQHAADNLLAGPPAPGSPTACPGDEAETSQVVGVKLSPHGNLKFRPKFTGTKGDAIIVNRANAYRSHYPVRTRMGRDTPRRQLCFTAGLLPVTEAAGSGLCECERLYIVFLRICEGPK